VDTSAPQFSGPKTLPPVTSHLRTISGRGLGTTGRRRMHVSLGRLCPEWRFARFFYRWPNRRALTVGIWTVSWPQQKTGLTQQEGAAKKKRRWVGNQFEGAQSPVRRIFGFDPRQIKKNSREYPAFGGPKADLSYWNFPRNLQTGRWTSSLHGAFAVLGFSLSAQMWPPFGRPRRSEDW